MKRVRIEHEGSPAWGQLRDGEVVLDSGAALDPATAKWLAPVEPSKILAVHLTYRSRLVDYDARQPAEPSYFLKPPSSLNGHLGVIRRPRGARYLNYEGELAVVVGTRMHGVAERDVHDYVYGYDQRWGGAYRFFCVSFKRTVNSRTSRAASRCAGSTLTVRLK